MPGETTIPIVPCDERGDHPPHQRGSGSAREGMCPGVPPRNPDGSPATGDAERVAAEEGVRAALSELAEEVKAAEAALAAQESKPLIPSEHTTVHSGMLIVIAREANAKPPRFHVHIDRGWAEECHTHDGGRAQAGAVTTSAIFEWTDPSLEADALVRAEQYARRATEIIALFREVERNAAADLLASMETIRRQWGAKPISSDNPPPGIE